MARSLRQHHWLNLKQPSGWLSRAPDSLLGLCPWKACARRLLNTLTARPEYLLPGPGLLAALHPDPPHSDAAAMDAVFSDMLCAVCSEVVPVTAAWQTPSFKGYWLKNSMTRGHLVPCSLR